jgi:hypothetical protein
MTTCRSIADCFPPLPPFTWGKHYLYARWSELAPEGSKQQGEHDDFTDKVSAKFTSLSVGGEGMNTFHPPDSEWVKISSYTHTCGQNSVNFKIIPLEWTATRKLL